MPGNYVYTVPAGVTSVMWSLYGAGGGGGGADVGGNGDGGASGQKLVGYRTLSLGEQYTLIVAGGGGAGVNDASSSGGYPSRPIVGGRGRGCPSAEAGALS